MTFFLLLGEQKQWVDFSEADGLQSDCCQQSVSSLFIRSIALQFAFLHKCEEMQYNTVVSYIY